MLELPGLERAIAHILENATIDADACTALKDEFITYKAHLLRAYECMYSSLQECNKVAPILLEHKPNIINSRVISVLGGSCTPEQARTLVLGLTKLRSFFRNSQHHHAFAKQKETVLIENNVSFVKESDLFDFRYEDKLEITRQVMSFTGVV
jgi:hypothetical protein